MVRGWLATPATSLMVDALETRGALRRLGNFDVDSRKSLNGNGLHSVLVYLTPHSRG